MPSRELILLSPYRFPAQHSLMLSSEDVATFMNGYAALWHPAALQGAVGPPRIASPFDYEQPAPGHIYSLPENPPPVLPDDWQQRVRDAEAISFQATQDRAATLANLRETLRCQDSQSAELLNLDPAKVAAFLGIGFGYCMVETLFEAMDHQNVLSAADFWVDVQQAVHALSDSDPNAYRAHLQSAADKLLAARDVLYPVSIHVLDMCLLDEENLRNGLPSSFERKIALNVIAAAQVLEKLDAAVPGHLAQLRQAVHDEVAEVCGGCYAEREDAMLPIESQVWNLAKGQETYQRLLGREVQVFARKRFGHHPQLPTLLQNAGLRKALLVSFDESVLPTYRAAVINWPSPDGKQVDAFTRPPHRVDDPLVFFHWAHYLQKTIAQDFSATLALLHSGKPAAPWYEDLLELSRFGPVLGQWTTLSKYLNEVSAGEYAAPPSADDFRGDYLTERTSLGVKQPVGWFADHLRLRRRVDAVGTLAALYRGLVGRGDQLNLETKLTSLADRVEAGAVTDEAGLVEQEVATALANRLLARAAENSPGYLLLNPCSFARRVALEVEGLMEPLPPGGPLKACQVDGKVGKLVVDLPALGFSWVPRTAATVSSASLGRMRLADARHVRNEFFEAEIDLVTGGLRALRDHRTRANRLGQQVVYNPGSVMRAKEIKLLSSGPAVGEIESEGVILNDADQVLAHFRQRFRAWLGRPVLELRIEITPHQSPHGYPWHEYFGARFAWGDERATLSRGVNGTSTSTSYTRPETPDFLEIRSLRQSTVILPGGLPFHQRHAGRMLDVILVPEGETTQAFELGIGLDREYPIQTALGMVTPTPYVVTSKGPPHVGSSGWLFHLDSPNLMLSSLRPAGDGADAIVARFLECGRQSTQAELRCARNPRRAHFVDAQGNSVLDASVSGDAVLFEVAAGDLVQLRVEFE